MNCTTCPPERPRELRPGDPTFACRPCVSRAHGWLAHELPRQMRVLRASRERETTGARTATRSRAGSPPPGRLDVLNLLGPGADGVHDAHGDQTGPLPIATVLGSWVLLVTEERRLRGPGRRPAEDVLAAWLAPHIEWAAGQPWYADMHDELAAMMREIRAKTRVRPMRRAVPHPCPRCQFLTLIEEDHQLYRECMGCGSLYTAEELADAAPEQLLAHEAVA